MYYYYLETFMHNLDLGALAEAELMLSKQSWHGHHAARSADVYGSGTFVIPDAAFEEWETLDIDRGIIRESEWEAEENFAKKHGLHAHPHGGSYDEFAVGVIDGFLGLIRMVLRNSGITPQGASDYAHDFQQIPEVDSFLELLTVGEIDADDQYHCGIVSGKLQALNRFGRDEWELDDIKLKD
jgi:hypothetical protein